MCSARCQRPCSAGRTHHHQRRRLPQPPCLPHRPAARQHRGVRPPPPRHPGPHLTPASACSGLPDLLGRPQNRIRLLGGHAWRAAVLGSLPAKGHSPSRSNFCVYPKRKLLFRPPSCCCGAHPCCPLHSTLLLTTSSSLLRVSLPCPPFHALPSTPAMLSSLPACSVCTPPGCTSRAANGHILQSYIRLLNPSWGR